MRHIDEFSGFCLTAMRGLWRAGGLQMGFVPQGENQQISPIQFDETGQKFDLVVPSSDNIFFFLLLLSSYQRSFQRVFDRFSFLATDKKIVDPPTQKIQAKFVYVAPLLEVSKAYSQYIPGPQCILFVYISLKKFKMNRLPAYCYSNEKLHITFVDVSWQLSFGSNLLL